MRDMLLNNILFDMSKYINNYQLEKLKETINYHLYNLAVIKQDDSNILELDYNKLFLSSKKLEGCSIRTVEYYDKTVNDMLSEINKNIKLIDTNDIRNYLSNYQSNHNCSNVTIDNIRRILSSFFSWLENEDYIMKSPIRRIHKIKTQITVKETYSDENLEKLRDGCHNIRDLAMIDFLSSTGVRVGELVNLNIDDIAEHMFLNKSYISRLFKSETGLTISVYINMRRVMMAKNLLLAGENAMDIFYQCGFSDYTTFYRVFKKYTDMSPEQFKKKHSNI